MFLEHRKMHRWIKFAKEKTNKCKRRINVNESLNLEFYKSRNIPASKLSSNPKAP